MPSLATRQVDALTDRLQSYGRGINSTIDTVGRIGGFALAGSLVGRNSPDLSQKMHQIQSVYDTFGREATTGLMASHAAASAVKKLPGSLRGNMGGAARSVVKAKPLLAKIVRIADTISRVF